MRRAFVLCVAVTATLVCLSAWAQAYTYALKWPEQQYMLEPCGVCVDSGGNIYVADTGNHRILKLNSSGVLVWASGTKGTGNGQFMYPQGLCLDDSGYLYVADTGNSRIQKLDTATGAYVLKWGSNGSGNSQFDWPTALTFSVESGVKYIWVADTGQYRDWSKGHRLKKFTTDGTWVATVGQPDSNEDVGLGEFRQAAGVAKVLTYILSIDQYGKRVQRCSTSGTNWFNIGLGVLNYPRGICAAPNYTLYVSDTNNNYIRRFDTSGTEQVGSPWGGYGTTESKKRNCLNFPRGIATDSSGYVYVADTMNSRVLKLELVADASSTVNFLARFGGRSDVDGAFDRPQNILIGPDGNVWVLDSYNNRVQKFSPSGAFISKFGTKGTSAGQLTYPLAFAFAPDGNILVADTGNHRVQKFAPDGTYLTKFGQLGTEPGRFARPSGIVTDAAGNIYVADTSNNRIQKFDSNGQFLAAWGEAGAGQVQFNEPMDLAMASDGNLLVADMRNHRIQKISTSGAYIASWGSFGSGNGQFNDPRGIGVDSSGNIYVADMENSRVQKLSPAGAFLDTFGGIGSDNSKMRQPADVAVASDGSVYVVERSNYRVQKFVP